MCPCVQADMGVCNHPSATRDYLLDTKTEVSLL